MKLNRWTLFLLLGWTCLRPSPLGACRYNVRDMGFVDLGGEPYMLYGFVRESTPADFVAQFTETASSALRDSNVQSEVVHSGQHKDHPALKHLGAWPASAALPVVLVSPDGQSRPVAVSDSNSGQPFKARLAAALAEMVASPTRIELLRVVSETFGAVLLIEGENAAANTQVRKTIAGALDQIRAQMKSLPKAIAQPPAMIVLDAASLAREAILLWSLGLTTEKTAEPRAAVIYGKARWIGPLMKGEEITERNLTGIFSILGADCECGLDISWTQGTRLPVRWDARLHAQVAKGLGFDPENPMVKIEASRIIGRRGSAPIAATGLGYQEVALDSGAGSVSGNALATGSSNHVAATKSRVATGPVTIAVVESTPAMKMTWLFLAGLAALIVAAGLLIVWRAVRKKRFE